MDCRNTAYRCHVHRSAPRSRSCRQQQRSLQRRQAVEVELGPELRKRPSRRSGWAGNLQQALPSTYPLEDARETFAGAPPQHMRHALPWTISSLPLRGCPVGRRWRLPFVLALVACNDAQVCWCLGRYDTDGRAHVRNRVCNASTPCCASRSPSRHFLQDGYRGHRLARAAHAMNQHTASERRVAPR